MINIITTIRNACENLEAYEFRRYVLIIFGILIISSGILIYYYYHATHKLIQKIELVNTQRQKAQNILERFEIVKKQETEVNNLLEQDKEFKIGGYFSNIMQQFNLSQKKTREPITSSIQLDNGYTEIQLYAGFSNMNMQEIVEFLDALEKNVRIYVKEIELYKQESGNLINLNLIIGTLQTQNETIESTE